MDDNEFLAAVAARLPTMLGERLEVTVLRPVGGRAWSRAEARFTGRARSSADHDLVAGSAYLPLDEEWRYLRGVDHPDDYARLLADKVDSEAFALAYPPDRSSPPTSPAEVMERWQWLLDRLAEAGRVLAQADGSTRVLRDEGGEFTVLVTPEQWARIAEPLDPFSDDPQDFNQLSDEDAFLVFFEDSMEWSIRPELPPVSYGGHFIREFREARERGDDMSQYGWFAYHPIDGAGERFNGGSD